MERWLKGLETKHVAGDVLQTEEIRSLQSLAFEALLATATSLQVVTTSTTQYSDDTILIG